MVKDQLISRDHFLIGSMIAVFLMFFFFVISPGLSLMVTFVPGIIASWLLFCYLFFYELKPPGFNKIILIYYIGISVQLLHFSEEHSMNFYSLFPELFGADAFSELSFVVFNMLAYGVFIIAPLLIYLKGKSYFLVPMLFFVVYGMIGNAVTHSYLSISTGSYFPGSYSAIVYFFIGPYALSHFIVNKRHFWIFLASFVLLLIIGLSLALQ